MKQKNMNTPPAGQPYIWQTMELRKSDAWRSAGINERRFIDYLMLEWMSKSGFQNGLLKAPHRQLVIFGIAARYVAETITRCEALGLVACYRGGMRVATTYSLTWLPLHDGSPASDQWRGYKAETIRPMSSPKKQKSALQREGRAALQREGRWPKTALQREGRMPQKTALQREGAYKKDSIQGAGDGTQEYQRGGAASDEGCDDAA